MIKTIMKLPLVFICLVSFTLAEGDEGPTVKLPDSLAPEMLANGVDFSMAYLMPNLRLTLIALEVP
jgi:hypothetical protein